MTNFTTLHKPPTFLMSAIECSSTCSSHQTNCTYRVAWRINPHMKVGCTCQSRAKKQHDHFRNRLKAAGAQIITLPFVHGAFDSVYIKDNAILGGGRGLRALLARPLHRVRQQEQEQRAFQLRKQGFQVEAISGPPLEGGDVVLSPSRKTIFLGHGFRSDPKSARALEKFMNSEVVPLQLVDPRFYHLDTALAITRTERFTVAFALRTAFHPESWNELHRHPEIDAVIPIPEAEALRFGLNWVEVHNHILLGSEAPIVQGSLREIGKSVEVCPLSEFQLGGGSAACLTAKLHKAPRPEAPTYDETWMPIRRDLNWPAAPLS